MPSTPRAMPNGKSKKGAARKRSSRKVSISDIADAEIKGIMKDVAELHKEAVSEMILLQTPDKMLSPERMFAVRAEEICSAVLQKLDENLRGRLCKKS